MGEGSYFNFDLIIERAGKKYRARVFDSPAGQASAEFDIPFSELELENFVLRMGRPRAGVRRVDSSEMEAVKQCGERLFRAVFTDDVYASFLRSRDTALEEEKGLRVRLRIDVPEFHDYPWEFLYNAHLNQFLALSKDTPVVRYLELPYPVQPLTVQPPLKILVMISSPEGFPQLNVEEEWRRLSNALAPLLQRGLVTLERLKNPTLSALQQRLRRGEYHIFHFVGHGKYSEHKQDGMLLLEEENGHGRPVSGQYLGTVLHDHRSLRLVVLNACEGARTSQEDPYAGVAQTLVLQGIPAVIAMQFEIIETAAITFAQEFYGAVADGFPVDAAVSEARKAIFATGNDVEWGTPVLYMRTPQGVIFEIPEALRTRQPATDESLPYVDKELEQKLEGLYTEGLAAFWVEDWDKACDRFQRILADRPDHAAAADKLAEAKRQRRLASLYARASEAQGAENWLVAQKTLEELLKDSPEYRDASTTLKMVKKQKRLAELYAEAKQLSAARKWEAVVKVFDQIKSIDPDYPDVENLLATAEKELEELKRQAELNELYSHAVHAMDAGHWEDAQSLLGQVQTMESGFLETEKLLSKVESEIRQSREEQKRRDQINTLYEQAHGLLRSKKWRQALDKIEAIRKLDEQFEDTEKITEQAQAELAREEQEAERQNELAAMYAEAVRLLREEKYQEALEKWQEIKGIDSRYPDRQKVQRTARKSLTVLAKPVTKKPRITVPKSLWIGLGGIVTIAVIVLALILSGNNGEEPSSPAISAPTSSSGGNMFVPTATKAPMEFTVTLLSETCSTYTTGRDFEGFISKSDDPIKPWSGTSVAFQGTDNCIGREVLGAASLIYRYRLEFNEVAQLTSIAVSGVAFNGPDSILRVLDENMHVLGSVETFGGNTFQTHIVTLQGVEGRIFFVDEFDTSPGWRFRQSIVVNGLPTAAQVTSQPTATQVTSGYADPTMYDDFDESSTTVDTSRWSSGGNDLSAKISKQDGILTIETNGYGKGIGLIATKFQDHLIRAPFFVEVWFKLEPNQNGGASMWLNPSDGMGTLCQIWGTPQAVHCQSYFDGFKEIAIKDVTSGTWHSARIEVDPSTMTFTYYIDGAKVGDYIPERADELKHTKFSVSIDSGCGGDGCNDKTPRTVTGYFDNIRIGAIADDSTMYDSFDNTTYNGKFDTTKWADDQHDPDGSAAQQDGALVFAQSGIEQGQVLRALQYWPFKVQDSIVFEANLKADMTSDGFVVMRLGGDVIEHASCGFHSVSDIIHTHCWSKNSDAEVAVAHGTWHVVRIEVNVDENKVNFFIDGKQLLETQYEQSLKGSEIYLDIHVWVGPDRVKNTRPMVGYVDNIRVLPLEYVIP